MKYSYASCFVPENFFTWKITLDKQTMLIYNKLLIILILVPVLPEPLVHKEVKIMAEITKTYETIFVLDTTIGEEAVNSLIEKFKSLIESNAQVENVDIWGKKRLAYPINYKTEGYYVLINFTAKPDFPSELERVYKITEGVLRSIVILKD